MTTQPTPSDAGTGGPPDADLSDDRGRRARESRRARAHLTLVQGYLRALRVARDLSPPARVQKPTS